MLEEIYLSTFFNMRAKHVCVKVFHVVYINKQNINVFIHAETLNEVVYSQIV